MLVASERPSLPPHLTPELMVADRRQKREIRQLEQELHKWQVLVDSITGEEARAPEGNLALVPCLPFWPSGRLFQTPSSPRHELSGLRQPDTGSAAGPHGAVPDALTRGEAGPSLPFLHVLPLSVPFSV